MAATTPVDTSAPSPPKYLRLKDVPTVAKRAGIPLRRIPFLRGVSKPMRFVRQFGPEEAARLFVRLRRNGGVIPKGVTSARPTWAFRWDELKKRVPHLSRAYAPTFTPVEHTPVPAPAQMVVAAVAAAPAAPGDGDKPKAPDRPPPLDPLDTDKQFVSSETGEPMALTLYGTARTREQVFLDLREIGEVFGIKNLSKHFEKNYPSLKEGRHWVLFRAPERCRMDSIPHLPADPQTPPSSTSYYTRAVERRFLTWAGFVQLVFRTRSKAPALEAYRAWAENTLFAAHAGTAEQRVAVAVEAVQGVPLAQLEALLGPSLGGLYMNVIGTVAEVGERGLKGQALSFSAETPATHMVIKIGRTKDQRRRAGEHRRGHPANKIMCGRITPVAGSRMEEAEGLAHAHFADRNLRNFAETALKEYFVVDRKHITGDFCELGLLFDSIYDRMGRDHVPKAVLSEINRLKTDIAVLQERNMRLNELRSRDAEQLTREHKEKTQLLELLDHMREDQRQTNEKHNSMLQKVFMIMGCGAKS